MGAKRFLDLHDFVRFGMNIHVGCANGHCDHSGVLDAYSCVVWFQLHRWPRSLDAGELYHHFRCTACGWHAGRLSPTENAVTVVDFFPADERGWKRLRHRLRG